ncbi:hypothetical protein [Chamaesiphon minutus]|nr:hypothetical protein [Chamaesiphon minutus]
MRIVQNKLGDRSIDKISIEILAAKISARGGETVGHFSNNKYNDKSA